MKKYQRGATMWTTLSVTLMVVAVAFFGFKLGDLFLDFRFIKASMQEVTDMPDFKIMTKKVVLQTINKRLTIDGIRGLDKEAITIKKDKSGGKYLNIKYSAKAMLIGNVYILVEFDEDIHRS